MALASNGDAEVGGKHSKPPPPAAAAAAAEAAADASAAPPPPGGGGGGNDVAAVPYFKLFAGADSLDIACLVLGTLGALGSGVMLPLFSLLFGDFVDLFGGYIAQCRAPPGVDFSALGLLSDDAFQRRVGDIALRFVYLAIGAGVSGFLQQSLWMLTATRQANRLRQRYLECVLRQDISFFDTAATSGGLLQGLNDDAADVQQGIGDKVGLFLQHTATFVAGYVLAFCKGWQMTLVMMALLPVLAGLGGLLARMGALLQSRATGAYTDAGAVVTQSLSQIRTVAAYCGEDAAARAYEAKLDTPEKVARQQGVLGGMALGGLQLAMFSSYALALYFGATRVVAGTMTGGQVMSVLFAALLGSFSLGMAAPQLQFMARAAAGGGRMLHVINRRPAIDSADEGGDAPAEVRGELELERVAFAYPARPGERVLSGFSLRVPAGKTVALVGESGSGKSTIVGLLERFYDPLEGRVLLDGVDIRTLRLSWLRDQVGLVSQEPTLFASSLFENIALGRPGASAADVHAAARAANAHNFIAALPQGYDTPVGERGVQLSGGQRQRIAIARAILKNPRVLLLDEATSALDAESEAIVQDALDRMVVGRTTVVVAHRLSTITNADTIVVMRAGAAVEEGTHAELLAVPNGAYANLVKLQMARTEMEVEVAAELAEVRAAGGAPITAARASLERVAARRRSLEQQQQHAHRRSSGGGGGGSGGLEEALAAERELVAKRLGKDLQPLVVVADAQGGSPSAAATSSDGSPAAGADGAAAAPAAATPAAAATAGGGGGGLAGWLRRRRGGAGKDAADKDAAAAEGEGEPAAAADVPFRRLWELNKQEWPLILAGLVGSVGHGASQPAFALVLASFTTTFFVGSAAELAAQASTLAWAFFAIGAGVWLATLLQQYCFGVAGAALARRVRQALFRAMLRQDVGWFDRNENASGKLAAALATDAAAVRGAVGDSLGVAAQNAALLGAALGIGFAYDWRMTLLILGAAPLIAIGGSIHLKLTFGSSTAVDKIFASANSALTEAVASIRTIQAYNLQPKVQRDYAGQLAVVNDKNTSTAVAGGVALGFSQLTMFSLYAIVTAFGGFEIVRCISTFDGFLKAFFAVVFAALGLAQAQLAFPDLAKAKSALARTFPIIDRRPAIDSADEGGLRPDARAVRGELELERVAFAYPSRPSALVLSSFSLRVPAGKTVALVGESGSGKSTIVGLLERFYDPLEGRVLLDGVDVRRYNVRFLRQQLGLVSQEPLLFSGTVRDNITYGIDGNGTAATATTEQVEAAARAANAHDFIAALPQGYDTPVGERGVQLSGGQRQRIAIARAVCRDPKVLILDEATSALDASSERVVQDALDRISKGRTTVVVAHRLSTIRDADAIAVVYRGVILEQGSHSELLAIPNGGYARLVAAQMRGGGGGGGGGHGGHGGGSPTPPVASA